MTINAKKFAAPSQPEIAQKTGVVLHFTAGSSVAGAVATWQTNFVAKKWALGTAYIVDRDGAVYEVFDPQKWAYHLAAGIANEKRTVGIEFVNWGAVSPNGSGFSPWIKSVSIDPADVGEGLYRGQRYWQKFPELQVKAGNELIRTICQRFDIPRVIPASDWRGIYAPQKANIFRGVMDHTNFREDKADMGPMWDWARTAKEIA